MRNQGVVFDGDCSQGAFDWAFAGIVGVVADEKLAAGALLADGAFVGLAGEEVFELLPLSVSFAAEDADANAGHDVITINRGDDGFLAGGRREMADGQVAHKPGAPVVIRTLGAGAAVDIAALAGDRQELGDTL